MNSNVIMREYITSNDEDIKEAQPYISINSNGFINRKINLNIENINRNLSKNINVYNINSNYLNSIISSAEFTLSTYQNITLIKKQTELRKIEEEKISTSNVDICPIGVNVKQVSSKAVHVDYSEIKDKLETNLYDYNLLEAVRCLFSSVFVVSSNKVPKNQRIKQLIDGLKRIGTESAFGYALSATVNNIPGLFIIKSSKDPTQDDLLHELFVGTFGTNKLRKIIPNFSYIFGGFKCSPPIIKDKKVITWCNNGKSVNYVVYENIFPSVPMKKYIETCTTQEFMSVFLQLLFSIKIAYDAIEFTHYDLHTDNVLIRDTPGKKTYRILYPKLGYIVSNKISTIIDYGFSHIKYNDLYFGIEDRIATGIYPNRGNPLHDVYKFLCFCLFDSAGSYFKIVGGNVQYIGNQAVIDFKMKNIEVFNLCSQLLKYFNNSENAYSVIQNQWNSRYSFPITQVTKDLSLEEFLNYITKIVNLNAVYYNLQSPPNINQLSCNKSCFNTSTVVSENLDKLTFPTDLESAYDLWLNDRLYNIKDAAIRGYSEIDSLFTSVVKLQKDTGSYTSVIGNSINNLLSKSVLESYEAYLYTQVEIKEDINRIKEKYTILKDLSKQKIVEYKDISNKNKNYINNILLYQKQLVNSLLQDKEYARSILKSNYEKSLYNTNLNIVIQFLAN